MTCPLLALARLYNAEAECGHLNCCIPWVRRVIAGLFKRRKEATKIGD